MSVHTNVKFNDILEIIESLPEDQRESLIGIVQRRWVEHRRDQLALNIDAARAEYKLGEIKSGTVEDLMKETSVGK